MSEPCRAHPEKKRWRLKADAKKYLARTRSWGGRDEIAPYRCWACGDFHLAHKAHRRRLA